jgi:hypothetical protein
LYKARIFFKKKNANKKFEKNPLNDEGVSEIGGYGGRYLGIPNGQYNGVTRESALYVSEVRWIHKILHSHNNETLVCLRAVTI